MKLNMKLSLTREYFLSEKTIQTLYGILIPGKEFLKSFVLRVTNVHPLYVALAQIIASGSFSLSMSNKSKLYKTFRTTHNSLNT